MSEKMKAVNILFSLFVVFAVLLTGCARSEEITPTSLEIAELSSAAGFLADRTEESMGFISDTDQREKASDDAYLYDNAVAAVVLSDVGAQWHAEKIADAIVFAQEHDRTFHDGRLRNAYISGNPKSDSGRSIAEGKVTVRLPGFWRKGRWQEDSYMISTSTGNMAWAILALCKTAENASGEKKAEYIAAAKRAADFVITLKSSLGGFTAGYEGWDDAQIKSTNKSTEHNIDLYCAFSYLADAVLKEEPSKAVKYKKASKQAGEFVLSMYDKKRNCFYAGTEKDGKKISDGVIPLDVNSLAVLAMGREIDDAHRILSFVEKRMTVGGGFDFSAGDLDGIWNEGTAQMAVAYDVMGNIDKYKAVMSYLKTQAYEDGSIPAADRNGVSTGFVIAGTNKLWEYNNVQSISATGWLAFAQLGKNPFERNSER